MLIILLFIVLLVVKLAAIGLISQFGAIVAIPIIAACLLIANRVEHLPPRGGYSRRQD